MGRRLFFLILLIVTWSAISAGQCYALEPLSLDEMRGRLLLAPHTEMLEDPTGEMTLAEASSPDMSGRYVPHPGDVVDIGLSGSAFWFRFKLAKTKPEDHYHSAGHWFLEFNKPNIGQIDLYIPLKENGEYLVKKGGSARPSDWPDLAFRTVVFEVPPGFNQEAYFYIRLKSAISLNMPLILWTPEAFIGRAWKDFFGFGIIYGVLVSMILYNLFIFFFLRDKVYFYYVLYVTSMLIYQLIMYGHSSAFFYLPAGTQERLFWAATGTLWFSATLFIRGFLNTRAITPCMDRVLLFLLLVAAMVIILGLAGRPGAANRLNLSLTYTAPFIGLGLGIYCLRRGYQPARYFLIAWSLLIAGAVLYGMGGIVLPRSFVTIYTLSIGSAAESILLSFALADRIRILQMEKESLKKSEQRYQVLSMTDELTALFNKRYLASKLAGEVDYAHRTGHPLSLVIMDVDDFKLFNDAYGHPEGDKVLKGLASVILESVRETDSACRYGGEEFCVIIPGIPVGIAARVAERVRVGFERLRFNPAEGVTVGSTISLGLAELAGGEGSEGLLKRADEALYQAKWQGKNRVVVG